MIKSNISEMNEFKNLPPAQREVAVHKKFIQLMIDAALGNPPQQTHGVDKKIFIQHKRVWFKSIEGGTELAEKLLTCGVWEAGLNSDLLPFIKAVHEDVGLKAIHGLPVRNNKV